MWLKSHTILWERIPYAKDGDHKHCGSGDDFSLSSYLKE